MPVLAWLILLFLLARPAVAEEIDSQVMTFIWEVSTDERAAAEKWGAEHYRRAAAAHHPARPRVARVAEFVLISLESRALCDNVQGCPLLVFRTMTARPVLSSAAFDHPVIEFRKTGTWLILHRAADARECLISLPHARCSPWKPAKRKPGPAPL